MHMQLAWDLTIFFMFFAGGRGTLTIRQARGEDEGAYTCEAMNNKGNVLGIPDLILTVNRELELSLCCLGIILWLWN